jgi:hypothetical protein
VPSRLGRLPVLLELEPETPRLGLGVATNRDTRLSVCVPNVQRTLAVDLHERVNRGHQAQTAKNTSIGRHLDPIQRTSRLGEYSFTAVAVTAPGQQLHRISLRMDGRDEEAIHLGNNWVLTLCRIPLHIFFAVTRPYRRELAVSLETSLEVEV